MITFITLTMYIGFVLLYVTVGIMCYVNYINKTEKWLNRFGLVLMCGPGAWIIHTMEIVFRGIDRLYYCIEKFLTKK